MKTEHLAGAMVGVCGKVMSSTFDVIDSEHIFLMEATQPKATEPIC